jgi:RNA:NAD 2'-phosphotransferase (TPT1/KptA family)
LGSGGAAAVPKAAVAKVRAKPQALTKASMVVGAENTKPEKPEDRQASAAGHQQAGALARNLVKALRHGGRHAPPGFQLKLDKDGWLPKHDMLELLARWHVQDAAGAVQKAIAASGGRLELSGKGLRANAGHTIQAVQVSYPTVKTTDVPEKLYHATTEAAVASILKQGLKSSRMQGDKSGRKHVYFWDRPLTTDKRPVLFEIAAQVARRLYGVVFVKEHTRGVFLTASRVPAACVHGPLVSLVSA